MREYEEPPFRFDFRSATHSTKHDKQPPDDWNTFWPGVDFRVTEKDREVWIEVKSWKFKAMRDRAVRQHTQSDYYRKLLKKDVEAFRDEIVTKFFGTTSYLVWSKMGIPETVYYVVFLEPPNRGSRALLGPFQTRLREQFKDARSRPWGKRIRYTVVDLAQFQQEFPTYPVTWL